MKASVRDQGRGLAKRFAASRGGNIGMMFAVLLLPLLVAAGMAIDIARSSQADALTQEAADAAALRVARAKIDNPKLSDAELSKMAVEIVRRALAKSESITIDGVVTKFDPGTRGVGVKVSGGMSTTLMRVAGVKSMSVDAMAEAQIGEAAPLELALALDVTGSMNQKNKIGDMKKSALDLVESVYAASSASKISVVPFAQYVNVGAAAAGSPWLDAPKKGYFGCVGSRKYPLNIEDRDYAANKVPGLNGNACPPPVTPLTSDKNTVTKAIESLKADGWTYIAGGLVWGWRTLSPEPPFTGGMTKQEMEETKAQKALVLLTDGENTRAPSYPEHNSADAALADKLLIQACNNVKADGIKVYTIAFDLKSANIKSLLEDCASTPGDFYDAMTSHELAKAFKEISSSLETTRLVR